MAERTGPPSKPTPPRRTVHSPRPPTPAVPTRRGSTAGPEPVADTSDEPTSDLEHRAEATDPREGAEPASEESLKVALNRPVPLSDLLKAEKKKSAIAMEATHVGPREGEEPS